MLSIKMLFQKCSLRMFAMKWLYFSFLASVENSRLFLDLLQLLFYSKGPPLNFNYEYVKTKAFNVFISWHLLLHIEKLSVGTIWLIILLFSYCSGCKIFWILLSFIFWSSVYVWTYSHQVPWWDDKSTWRNIKGC